MTWHDLLFMHWPLPVDVLRSHIPAELELDRYDGRAWIGVVPFHMTGVRPSVLPRFMALSFPEVNVRTYVRHKGRPGVWFFSLDAADRKTVWVARRFFHLPYHFAEMSAKSSGDVVEYRSHRRSNPEIGIMGRYKPVGPPRQSASPDLDYFLTERYSLFSADRNRRIYRCDVQHPPWPLQPAEAEMQRNTLTVPLGIPLPAAQPLLHFARRLDVVAGGVVRVS
jgi:uncharacterized protein YqjF (DUF2071 family)